MKTRAHGSRPRQGYTLVEMTLVVMVGITVASVLMMIVNQQFFFLRIFRSQNFLAEEAPVINTQLSSIIRKADRFRLYNSMADARTGSNAVMEDASTMLLTFQQPDGSMKNSIISWDTVNGSEGLYCYVQDAAGNWNEPDWAITRLPDDVSFRIENGVLRITLTGPAGEEVVYSGAMQL